MNKGIQNMNLLAENWSTQKFETIDDTETFRKLLEKMVINKEASVEAEQLKHLNVAINDFFMAFYQGDFESYRRFVIPTGKGHYDPQNLKWRLNDIKMTGNTPDTTNLEEGERIFQDYWAKFGKKAYAKVFQGLCIEKSHLDINRFFVLPAPSDLTYKMGMSSSNPTFISEPDPVALKNKSGSVLFATLTAHIKNSGGTAYPVVCRWYYSPEDAKWIPAGLGDDHSRANIKKTTNLTF